MAWVAVWLLNGPFDMWAVAKIIYAGVQYIFSSGHHRIEYVIAIIIETCFLVMIFATLRFVFLTIKDVTR